MTKKKEVSITKTKEFTRSDTQSNAGTNNVTIEELLGTSEAPGVDDDRFLLKLKTFHRLDRIIKKLSVECGFTTHDKVANVIGPFSKSQILALCESKLLTKRDELLVPQSTWKGISDVLMEVKQDQLLSDEVTSTHSVTESITETAASHMAEQTATPTPNIPIEKMREETLVRPIVREPKVTAPARPNVGAKPKTNTPPIRVVSAPQNLPLASWIGILALITVGLFTVWKYGPFSKVTVHGSRNSESTEGNQGAEWPEYLKAKAFEDLRVNRSPLLAKLDPILEAYEKGARAISEPDLKLLKVLASPGSASLEARVLATNLLAALALSKSQTDEARRLLDKMLETVPTDSTTLINRSLTSLVGRENKEAKEIASTALRLCKGQSCWVARAMLGLIAAEEERWAEADENFKAALDVSRGSLWVVGLWMRSLKGASRDLAKAKSGLLLTDALVLDPDLMIDSPLRAPLATQIFLTEALRGFRSALSNAPDAITEGQKKYIEWLISRLELNPLASSAQEALDLLRSEAPALSQLASSYLEKENNHLDRASEIISKILPRLSGTSIKSSWPWSFAGDIQRNRGLYDQAIIFYEGALSRNPRDVNAVFGLALILREKKDYKSAYQKIEEAEAIDPDFIPAQLRRDRFEWQRYWLSK